MQVQIYNDIIHTVHWWLVIVLGKLTQGKLFQSGTNSKLVCGVNQSSVIVCYHRQQHSSTDDSRRSDMLLLIIMWQFIATQLIYLR